MPTETTQKTSKMTKGILICVNENPLTQQLQTDHILKQNH